MFGMWLTIVSLSSIRILTNLARKYMYTRNPYQIKSFRDIKVNKLLWTFSNDIFFQQVQLTHVLTLKYTF